MIGKLGTLSAMLLLLSSMPLVGAEPLAAADNCTGHYVEDPPGSGEYTCYGVCDDSNPTDDCVGPCTSGGCLKELLNLGFASSTATVSPDGEGDCYGISDEETGNCTGVEGGCRRLVPKRTIYSPLNGEELYTVDIKTEMCL